MAKAHMEEVPGQAVSVIIKALIMLPRLRKLPVKHISIQQKILKRDHGKQVSFAPSYHDHSLFFDDDGRVYLIYGAGN